MSALDQAFIKAYAKDRFVPGESATVAAGDSHGRGERSVASSPRRPAALASPPVAEASAPAHSRQAAVHTAAATIEQLYHDGALYRIDVPRAATPGAGTVPPPHLLPPPTSPRRGVRRSLLKLWAEQSAAQSAQQGSGQRVARKVIIRHVSHSVAPPANHWAELPPETVFDEPPPTGPLPAAPLDPQTPLLNERLDSAPRIAVQGFWQAGAQVPGTVVLAQGLVPAQETADGVLVAARIDSVEALTAGDDIAQPAHAGKQEKPSATDSGSPPQFRIDRAHVKASHRPHVDFSVQAQSAGEGSPVANASGLSASAMGQAPQELGLAEPIDEPLASDLVPPAGSSPANSLAQVAAPAAKPTTPVWEVDRFHWPRTCETLLSDETGYFANSQQKLLAAVQDGLRVLAVTGSRRGEGRTTLALCLARSAAAAGIQVALMDVDFGRPQVAAKTGLDVAFGWQEAALGRVPLSEACVKSLADKITILPLERTAASNCLSLADPRVTATIRAAAATFELLILDLGPLGRGEQIAFPPGEACPLDAAIIVRDMRFATAAESEAVGRMLQATGLDAVGIAENFVVEEE